MAHGPEKPAISDEQLLKTIVMLTEQGGLSNQIIYQRVMRFRRDGNPEPLLRYIRRHPVIFRYITAGVARGITDKALNPFRPWPTHQEALEKLAGQIPLGKINTHGDNFLVNDTDLPFNILMVAKPGSGKTNTVILLVVNSVIIENRGFNWIIYSYQKRELRSLVIRCYSFKVLPKKIIKINPFQVPDGLEVKEHITIVVDVLVSEAYLGPATRNELFIIVLFLYKSKGCFEGSRNWPTMHDLLKAIREKRNKTKSYRLVEMLISMENRISIFVESGVFDCQESNFLSYYFKRDLIIEVDGFDSMVANFLVAFPIRVLYSIRVSRGEIDSKPRTGIVIDEARTILQADRNINLYGESAFNQDIMRFRASGIFIVIATQNTASISNNLRASIGIKISMQMSDAKEIDFVAQGWLLTPEQRSYLMQMPRYGQAIVFAPGRFSRPFLMAIPRVDLPDTISDEELSLRMESFWAEFEDSIVPLGGANRKPPSVNAMKADSGFLLVMLSDNPFAPKSRLREMLPRNVLKNIEKNIGWLLNNGFLEEKRIKISATKPSTFYPLTELAYEHLGIKAPPGKGSFEHKLMQHLIAEHCQTQGRCEANIEGRVKGSAKSIDVLVIDDAGNPIGYEVSLSHSVLNETLIQDFAAGVKKVIVVTRNDELDLAANTVAGSSELERHLDSIDFRPISHFVMGDQ